MQKLKLLIIALLFLAALVNSSCRKEMNTPGASPVNTSSLAGTYQVTAISLQPNSGDTPEDLFASIDDCQKQSRQVLNANGSYQLLDACDATQNSGGTWALQSTQFLTINGVTGKLVSFDGKQLVLSFDNFMGLPGTLTETLSKQ